MMRLCCSFFALSLAVGAGCSPRTLPDHSDAHPAPPATVENAEPESEIARVRLTPEAVARLAIESVTIETRDVERVRTVAGEVVIPPGQAIAIAAPVASVVHFASELRPGSVVHAGDTLFELVPLAPIDRDARTRATRELELAQARVENTEQQLERARTLAAGNAGSLRAVADATEAREIASADLAAAERTLRTIRSSPMLSDTSLRITAQDDGIVRGLSVSPEQVVAANAPLLEVVTGNQLWVRAPVPSSDLRRLDMLAPASISHLGQEGGQASVAARAVVGPPPTLTGLTAVDRFFALPDDTTDFVVGEVVAVAIPATDSGLRQTVPYSAVLYDNRGGQWVYAENAPGHYQRERVEVLWRAGDLAVLGRGPSEGTRIVSVGAAEVFGAEFQPGH
jgi:RND family efflux transporter MFP subunit